MSSAIAVARAAEAVKCRAHVRKVARRPRESTSTVSLCNANFSRVGLLENSEGASHA